MSERRPFDRLDAAVDALFSDRGPRGASDRPDPTDDLEVVALLAVAEALRDLPRVSFKARLRSELERTALMMTSVTEPVSAIRQTASARLRVRNAAAAIEFYKRAFNARELMRFEAGGSIAHVELAIGNSVVMLGEEAPEYGYPGPESLGGSPAGMHLYVDDADAWVARAVAAGARIVSPVTDQFYGDRSGQIADPFGYGWTIATRTVDMTVEEMHQRFADLGAQAPRSTGRVPAGFRTVTPYVVVQDAPGLIAFAQRVFDAEQTSRTTGHEGGVHAEVRVGDSMLMIGGGAPELGWRGEHWPTAFHVYVPDTDATYARALEAGATSLGEPADMDYGERGAGVRDPFGNVWYIATAQGARHIPKGVPALMVYMHPRRADAVIAFLKKAFDAQARDRYASPDGVVHHATVAIGDSIIEMGDAKDANQPMPTRFYVFVQSVDAAYRRALIAGATSVMEPTNQQYGHRNAGVKDPFGNEWFLATVIEEP
jgi:PhnB protein